MRLCGRVIILEIPEIVYVFSYWAICAVDMSEAPCLAKCVELVQLS